MSIVAVFNTNKAINMLFSSLPNDIVSNVLGRVPRHHLPILSCVSKSLRSLICSPEFRNTLRKDDFFYVCFKEESVPSPTFHWFTLNGNGLVSIPFPSQPEPCSAVLMVGHEIYFVGGHNNHFSRNMWILDPLSGKLRQAPSMLVARYLTAVGLVDHKIYVFGGCEEYEEIQAEVFDTNTQTWEVAPNPDLKCRWIWMSMSRESKIYVRNYEHGIIVYDPRDGKCETIKPPHYAGNKDVCVIGNILYIYDFCFGLMWYESKKKEWKVVKDLKLNHSSCCRVMAENNGKLAFFQEFRFKRKIEFRCAMIALDWNGVEIIGKIEWSDLVLSLPNQMNNDFKIMHCLGRTD